MKLKNIIKDVRFELTKFNLIIITASSLLNILLHNINNYLNINLWWDSAGTILSSIIAGPWSAVITSLLSFIILGLRNGSYYFYVLIPASIGLTLGYLQKKNNLIKKDSQITHLLGVCFLIGLFSTIIYSIITSLLLEAGNDLINQVLNSLVGAEFLAQLLDKTISFFTAFIIILTLPDSYFRNIKNIKGKKALKLNRNAVK